MKKLFIVFGTRPEAIKLCPLVLELKRRGCFDVRVCVTGQHRSMLDSVLALFGVVPDYDLNIMRQQQTLSDITSSIVADVTPLLLSEAPDCVIVHGDTTTSFSAALAAFYLNIPVAHVEAGLRTYNLAAPFPEEFNRRTVGLIASLNFAPTFHARENLLREGVSPASIFVTGNTVIDAMRYTVRPSFSNSLIDWAADSRLLLITAHRRENFGVPMHDMFIAIRRVLADFPDVKAVYPVHLNPAVRSAAMEHFSDCDRIRLTEPMDAADFHNFMAASTLILTDSGGIQEEAPALGKPVLVMRSVTERPEGIEAGTLKLVGTDSDAIYDACRLLLTDNEEYRRMSNAVNPYGDGHACERIADALELRLNCDNSSRSCMLISIIISLYQQEKYINDCVNSVLTQSYSNIEVILVDDGSTDATPSMCDGYAKRDARIKVIHKPNGGLSDARNHGMAAATGEYVAFLDGDDMLASDSLEDIVRVISAQSYPDLIYGKFNSFSNDGTRILYDADLPDNVISGDVHELIRAVGGIEFIASACRFFIKRDFIESNGLSFSKGLLHEDELFTVQLLCAASTYAVYRKPHYLYRTHGNSITTSATLKNKLDLLKIACMLVNLEDKYAADADKHSFLESRITILTRRAISEGSAMRGKFMPRLSAAAAELGHIYPPAFAYDKKLYRLTRLLGKRFGVLLYLYGVRAKRRFSRK